jgi:hypothetical protein
MPAPQRRGAWGTVESVLDDLLLIRDAGGLAASGADRVEATLRLSGIVGTATQVDVAECRALITKHIGKVVMAYNAVHRGDPVATAAADSAETILLQPLGSTKTAAGIRRDAIGRHESHIQPDSLRKRELPVLVAIADSVFADLTQGVADEDDPLSVLQLLNLLKPFTELADTAVTYAVELLMKRAALNNEELVADGLAHAIWAVAQLGVLPVYALDRLEQIGETDVAHSMIGYALHAMISVPFQREPRDMDQLATAIQPGEEPEGFYERLLATPIMRPVVQRFIEWLGTHDPQTCQVDSNDVMVGYCRPHYYAAICEGFEGIAEEWASGVFQREAEAGLAALQAAGVSPPSSVRKVGKD